MQLSTFLFNFSWFGITATLRLFIGEWESFEAIGIGCAVYFIHILFLILRIIREEEGEEVESAKFKTYLRVYWMENIVEVTLSNGNSARFCFTKRNWSKYTKIDLLSFTSLIVTGTAYIRLDKYKLVVSFVLRFFGGKLVARWEIYIIWLVKSSEHCTTASNI